jgi:predicted PurR-regulated permease PerM
MSQERILWLTPSKSSWVGWSVLLGLLGLFLFLDLLRFLVFLLFMHLVIDLLVHSLVRWLPFVPRKIILYAVILVLAAVLAVLALVIAPRFVSDLPAYTLTLERNLGTKVNELLSRWNFSIEIPELKIRALQWGREHLGETFDLARRVGTNVVLLIVALIITFLITHDRMAEDRGRKYGSGPYHLWEYLAEFIEQKVGMFYGYFRQTMAAQVVISVINATLTLGLLLVLGIPHKLALAVLVFVFGLLPIVGNLISNTLICVSALLWSGPWQVVAALGFLVVIHKLEYFLNGKIIGNIVKLPMYLTLLGLIVGEALFNISGMILSIPVILFVRAELSAIRLGSSGPKSPAR